MQFSKDERRVLDKFLKTDLGVKLLDMILELKDDQVRKALYGAATDKGAEFTHDYITRAAAIESVYYMLAPIKKATPDSDDD